MTAGGFKIKYPGPEELIFKTRIKNNFGKPAVDEIHSYMPTQTMAIGDPKHGVAQQIM